MESSKNKMLRVVDVIYDIRPFTHVKITKDSEDTVFVCMCIGGEYELYNPEKSTQVWGLCCGNLEDMRKSLMGDFIDGLYENIKIGESTLEKLDGVRWRD